jgi:surface antigen
VPVAFYPPTDYPSYLYAPMEGYPGCYEYETTVDINGQPSPAWGTACLQRDGTRQVIN